MTIKYQNTIWNPNTFVWVSALQRSVVTGSGSDDEFRALASAVRAGPPAAG